MKSESDGVLIPAEALPENFAELTRIDGPVVAARADIDIELWPAVTGDAVQQEMERISSALPASEPVRLAEPEKPETWRDRPPLL